MARRKGTPALVHKRSTPLDRLAGEERRLTKEGSYSGESDITGGRVNDSLRITKDILWVARVILIVMARTLLIVTSNYFRGCVTVTRVNYLDLNIICYFVPILLKISLSIA